MFIRRATAEELRFIQSYAPIVQQEATLGYMDGKHVLNEEMHYHYKAEYFTLLDNHRICGWVLLGEAKTPVNSETMGMVLELYVLQPYRKKGFGHMLMNYALHYFKQKKLKKVQLNVFAGNFAKKLYEQMGFKDVSTLMERPL
ncbi:GNAT family N-acetyltransferase [Halalkalibacter flavus]|uniref:GNAT family N-acetyltransferase n=1 Tax=Halalkalibacter flavus TaxID=3090668 RepID=UPI002FCC6D2C